MSGSSLENCVGRRQACRGEAEGLTQTLRVDFLPDLKPGDYVMVHAGFAIEKLTEQQARENLACIQEAIDALS